MIQLGSIFPKYLSLRLDRRSSKTTLDRFLDVSVQASDVWKVGLKHDPIDWNHVEQMLRSNLLEPHGGINLPSKELRWKQPVIIARTILVEHRTPVVVSGLEREWDPPDTTLNRNDLQLWKSIQGSGRNNIGALHGILQEELDAHVRAITCKTVSPPPIIRNLASEGVLVFTSTKVELEWQACFLCPSV